MVRDKSQDVVQIDLNGFEEVDFEVNGVPVIGAGELRGCAMGGCDVGVDFVVGTQVVLDLTVGQEV